MMTVRQLILALFVAVMSGIALAQVSGDDSAAPGEPAAETESSEELAAEDAEVDKVLSDAELVYGDDSDDDFIPSKSVSADQSIDYPVDI